MGALMHDEFTQNLYRGGELLAAGKVIEAKEYLERAYALDPRNEKGQNLLGLTYFKLGLFDRAAEIYEALVQENPVDATLRVNLGLVYLKTQTLQRAIREFENAVDLAPDHKKAHNYLGLALAQDGQYSRAKEHFREAGSDAMAEKMERALAGESAGLTRAPAPLEQQETQRFAEIEGSEVVAEAGGQQVADEAWGDAVYPQEGRQDEGPEDAPDDREVSEIRPISLHAVEDDDEGPVFAPEELGGVEALDDEEYAAEEYTDDIGDDEVLPAKEEDEEWEPQEHSATVVPLRAEPAAREPEPEPEAEPSEPEQDQESTFENGAFHAESEIESGGWGGGGPNGSAPARQEEPETRPPEPDRTRPAEPEPTFTPARPALKLPKPLRVQGPDDDLDIEEWRAESLADLSLSAALPLPRLAADEDVLRGEMVGPFELRRGGAAVVVTKEMYTRTDGLLVMSGEVTLTPEMKRFRGEPTEQSFGEGAGRMMHAKGKGALIIVGPRATRFVPIDLVADDGFFREDAVYAFESDLAFENGRVTSAEESFEDVDVVHLRGDGQVLLRVPGEIRSAKVTAERPATVSPDRLVGWYGSVAPRIGPAGFELSGEGFVLFSVPMR